jgi:hypothetical protein
MSDEWTSLEVAKLSASLVSPMVTIIGFSFVWWQLKNTAHQIEIARESLKETNRQNATNQAWKRGEFVAGEIKLFYESDTINKVLQILDYEARFFDIGVTDHSGKAIMTKVVHCEKQWPRAATDLSYVAVVSAIRIHDADCRFTAEEVFIRDSFDIFLYSIERFERFLKTGLLSEDEIFHYLSYYLRLFRGQLNHIHPKLLTAFRSYLTQYHFEEAEHFLYCRFGNLLGRP